MAQRVFKMSGRKYYSIMDMAREIGVDRIYSRDFGKYGIVEITGTPEASEPDSPVTETAATDEVSNNPAKKSKKTKSEDDKKLTEKSDKKVDNTENKTGKVSYTIDDLVKMSIEEFSKNIRKIDTDDIIKFADDNCIESHSESDDSRIRRMKVVMELKKKYFPNQSVPTKKASFKGVDIATLVKFAEEKKVDYKKSSEDKIQKMWVIYALNKAGYYDLPKEDGDSNSED